ncbi:hypothetical protein B0T21DRAFT_378498 [Apiosordaria backusii]|uniref:Uncharacterized protein n=1 Tax=Apiosordaria backusii TaxID=314023 RepID=A0AA39ZS18_9PEZI|nr:hypothetical protein B0T21DRAFT_378498 [Apiosordaria backusii]
MMRTPHEHLINDLKPDIPDLLFSNTQRTTPGPGIVVPTNSSGLHFVLKCCERRLFGCNHGTSLWLSCYGKQTAINKRRLCLVRHGSCPGQDSSALQHRGVVASERHVVCAENWFECGSLAGPFQPSCLGILDKRLADFYKLKGRLDLLQLGSTSTNRSSLIGTEPNGVSDLQQGFNLDHASSRPLRLQKLAAVLFRMGMVFINSQT